VDGIYLGHVSVQWETAVRREMAQWFHEMQGIYSPMELGSVSQRGNFSQGRFLPYFVWGRKMILVEQGVIMKCKYVVLKVMSVLGQNGQRACKIIRQGERIHNLGIIRYLSYLQGNIRVFTLRAKYHTIFTLLAR